MSVKYYEFREVEGKDEWKGAGPMTDEKMKQMKKLTRDHTHEIWEIAKTGDLDSMFQ